MLRVHAHGDRGAVHLHRRPRGAAVPALAVLLRGMRTPLRPRRRHHVGRRQDEARAGLRAGHPHANERGTQRGDSGSGGESGEGGGGGGGSNCGSGTSGVARRGAADATGRQASGAGGAGRASAGACLRRRHHPPSQALSADGAQAAAPRAGARWGAAAHSCLHHERAAYSCIHHAHSCIHHAHTMHTHRRATTTSAWRRPKRGRRAPGSRASVSCGRWARARRAPPCWRTTAWVRCSGAGS